MSDIPTPPEAEDLIIIENNPDYIMFLERKSVKEIEISLDNSDIIKVLQAWTLIQNKDPYFYETSLTTEKKELVYEIMDLSYYNCKEEKSLSIIQWYYNEKAKVINYMFNEEITWDRFSPIIKNTVEHALFEIIKKSYENNKKRR